MAKGALRGRIKKVIVVGAGDHGRGTFEIIKACNAQRFEAEVVGFLDDDPLKIGNKIDGIPVLGEVSWIKNNRHEGLYFILGIAHCQAKKALADSLKDLTPQFLSLVHPRAILGSDVKICSGSIIAAGVIIAYSSVIQEHVTVNLNSTIGHGCMISRYATIAPGANIAGKVTIGEGCDIGPNCTISKGLKVGSWSVLGPATVALRDISPKKTYLGNPARSIL